MCVEKIAGLNDVHPLDVTNMPGLHLLPAAGRLGGADRGARASEAGHEVKVGHFPFIGNGKAIAMGEPEGMVKTVFDAKTGELLGAHMVGAEVTELIQGYIIARTLESTEAELMHDGVPASDGAARRCTRRCWMRMGGRYISDFAIAGERE